MLTKINFPKSDHSTFSIEKLFFSKKFKIQFITTEDGGARGIFTHFHEDHTVIQSFEGLSLIGEDDSVKLTFILDWHNPGKTSIGLIAFAGEIIRYSAKDECMILKWHHVNENTFHESDSEENKEVMFDRFNDENIYENEKIMEHLSSFRHF